MKKAISRGEIFRTNPLGTPKVVTQDCFIKNAQKTWFSFIALACMKAISGERLLTLGWFFFSLFFRKSTRGFRISPIWKGQNQARRLVGRTPVMDNRNFNGNNTNPNYQAPNPPQGQAPQLGTNQLLTQLLQQMQVLSQLIINQNQAQNQNQNQASNPEQARGPLSIYTESEQKLVLEGVNPPQSGGPRNDMSKNEIPKGIHPVNMTIEVGHVPHFKVLLHTGAEVESTLDKKNESKARKLPSQFTSEKAGMSTIHQMNFSLQNPTSYSQYQHDSTPYSARTSTVAKNWTSIIPRPAGNQNYHTKTRKPPRKFSKLPNSLSRTFEELKEIGLIKPKHPTPVPNPVSRYWNVNEQCGYHQKPGHHTDNCIALRHAIQDLIDQKII